LRLVGSEIRKRCVILACEREFVEQAHSHPVSGREAGFPYAIVDNGDEKHNPEWTKTNLIGTQGLTTEAALRD